MTLEIEFKIKYKIKLHRLLAATTLRNILGTKTLQEILQEREIIAHHMQVSYERIPNVIFLEFILNKRFILIYRYKGNIRCCYRCLVGVYLLY